MFKADCHIHTTFSPDGHQTPKQLIAAAQNAGLTHIAVTDHCECNGGGSLPPDIEPWAPLDFTEYAETFEKIKAETKTEIAIGVELGQITQNYEYARTAISVYPWDFLIASLHNVKGEYDFCFFDYNGKDIKKLMENYFSQLYELAKYETFSVLGHLYYPMRYIYRNNFELNVSRYDEQIREIYRVLIEKGKGIEVNTSTFFDTYGAPVPGFEHIKMFREMGGEIVTAGSDAHYPERVGRGIISVYELMREAGFKYTAFFRNMKPEFYKI